MYGTCLDAFHCIYLYIKLGVQRAVIMRRGGREEESGVEFVHVHA